MYIDTLKIHGYKIFSKPTEIEFHSGLNVIVGENGCGKSSVIDAVRLLFLEDEYGRAGIADSDFYRPYESNAEASERINISAYLSNLSEDEKVAFLPWAFDEDLISLNLVVENKSDEYGRYKKVAWGGRSKSSMFEPELFEFIKCVYLPPLRDAESRLESGRNSRLARLLLNLSKHQDASSSHSNALEDKVNEFNQKLAEENTIAEVDHLISERLLDVLGNQFSQNIKIQFSPTELRRIFENLRLLFLPFFDNETSTDLFRSLDENSLGYNNIIYLATVLTELRHAQENKQLLNILLIEEPEAHLHPQMQIKLLRYLEDLSCEQNNIQIIITTHSPVITASISINSIIHVSKNKDDIISTPVRNCGLDETTKDFLERWLDVTKSTLFFSRGIIFVEGIAEGMLIPVFANRYLREKNQNETGIPRSLEEAGISIININGRYFEYFMSLFCDVKGNNDSEKIQLYCSGITDNDPPRNSIPTELLSVEGKNPVIKFVDNIAKSKNCRLFVSPLKTFEYDLAMQEDNLKLMLSLQTFSPREEDIKVAFEEIRNFDNWDNIDHLDNKKAKVSKYLLDQIDKGKYALDLAKKISNTDYNFKIPDYILDAIDWVTNKGVKNE